MKIFKKLTIAVLMIALTSPILLADEMAVLDDAVSKAAQQAVEKLNSQVKAGSTKFETITNVAVMPFWGEDADEYVSGTFSSYLANSNHFSLFARKPAEWDQLLGEIKWNTLREDIMNPSTVQRFGKIEGVDAIVYGTVRQRDIESWSFSAKVRMTLNMADVETGQVVWSSGPIVAKQWLEWPEILKTAVRHPVVWFIAGIIILLIVLRTVKAIVVAGTRPR